MTTERRRTSGDHYSSHDFLTVLFGLGLALTSATQLRVSALPIGPGEVLLVVWLGCSAAVALMRGHLCVNAVSRATLLFWTVALSLLSLGTLVAIRIDRFLPGSLHDFTAFLLSALTSVAFTLHPRLRERSMTVVDILLVAVGGTQFVLAALLIVGIRHVGPIDTFYEGARFQGWSNNPNQLAFVLLALPLFALHRAGTARTRGGRFWFAALAICPILPGAMCFSNALFFAWCTGLVLLVLVSWLRRISESEAGFFPRAKLLILFPAMVLTLTVLLGGRAVNLATQGLNSGYNYGDHGSERMNRWRFGVEAASNSPFIGLGPGSFSGPYQPFGGGEAHNTLLDWGSSTGLIGDLALLSLLGFAAAYSFRAGYAVGVAIVAAMLVFSSFHYILRQPVFWFNVLAVSSLGLPGTARRLRPAMQPRPLLTPTLT